MSANWDNFAAEREARRIAERDLAWAQIPVEPTLGTVSYIIGDYDVVTKYGWVSRGRDGNCVAFRHYGGRNTWQVTSLDALVGFTPAKVRP